MKRKLRSILWLAAAIVLALGGLFKVSDELLPARELTADTAVHFIDTEDLRPLKASVIGITPFILQAAAFFRTEIRLLRTGRCRYGQQYGKYGY